MSRDRVDAIATIRRFSRTYTERIGVLDERFLGLDRPLGEARFLFEIGHDGATIAEIRDRLGLDSGYASRLVRKLEADDLVRTVPDPDDRRRRRLALTPAGREAWRLLDERSAEQIEALTAPLGPRRTTELADLLDRADRLISAGAARFETVDPRSPDAQRAMSTYFAELDTRFRNGFDAGDALEADAEAFDPPSGDFVVVRVQGHTIGCGGLWTIEPGVGEIKRMWIDADWRGVGLAGRLLADLEARSRALGHTRTILDTNEVLDEAIAMYRRSGYESIARYNDNPYAHHWFEKRWPD